MTTSIACELQQLPEGPLFRKLRRGNNCRYCGPFSCSCCLCSRDCGQLLGRGCLHRSERGTRGSFRQENLGGVKRWLIRRGVRSDWGGISRQSVWRHWSRDCGGITLRGWGLWRRGWRRTIFWRGIRFWRRITFLRSIMFWRKIYWREMRIIFWYLFWYFFWLA